MTSTVHVGELVFVVDGADVRLRGPGGTLVPVSDKDRQLALDKLQRHPPKKVNDKRPAPAGKTVEAADTRPLHIQVAELLEEKEPDPDRRVLTLLRALERDGVNVIRQYPTDDGPPYRIVAGLGRFIAALRLRQLEGP